MADEMKPGEEKVVKSHYPPNSHKAKEAPKAKTERVKLEKVITGEARKQKKSLGRKISETITGDDMRSVGNYLVMDVFVPALKNLIVDMLSQGAERAFYGDTRRSRSGRPGYTSYNRAYTGSKPQEGRRELSQRSRASHDFDGIIIGDRGEAEKVIDDLVEVIRNYDVATVLDFYDLVDIRGNFVDEKWGWNDLRSAGVRRVRDGYLIDLPKPIELD